MEARALLPAGRRGHARRGRARVPGGAQRLRHFRRLDARQDRGGRPGCRGVPEPPLRQRFFRPRRGTLPLRHPAARGWLRPRRRRHRAPGAGPVSRDHDHRRRCARARDDGGLPPDGMAGARRMAHFDHRAMGRDSGAGTARATRDRAAHARHRPFVVGASAHGGGAGTGRRCPGDAVPRQLHRRARLRDQRAGLARPHGVGSGLRSRPRARHHALRHRDDARAARGEGLHHRRPGNGRHGDTR